MGTSSGDNPEVSWEDNGLESDFFFGDEFKLRAPAETNRFFIMTG